ncbi:MAG TPA: hypothetical protein VK166_04515 [Chitinophagaceae bacterium]|nr:hypothetical protein [Chitinophagaceae bacterium]
MIPWFLEAELRIKRSHSVDMCLCYTQVFGYLQDRFPGDVAFAALEILQNGNQLLGLSWKYSKFVRLFRYKWSWRLDHEFP